jgi:hypothetical protein
MTSIRDGRSASRAAHATPDSAGQPTDPAGPTGLHTGLRESHRLWIARRRRPGCRTEPRPLH